MNGDEPFDWDDLLAHVQGGKVVPIVGRDLLQVEVDKRRTTLDHHLAGLLVEELDIPCDNLSTPPRLHEVALRYQKDNLGTYTKIYTRLKAILDRETATLGIPKPLEQLARITDFKLFVSTTFDSLLVKALNSQVGRGGATVPLAYSPNAKLKDLPEQYDEPPEDDRPDHAAERSNTFVYQIFGQASLDVGDYAVTEAEILEFMYALQSSPKEKRPERLFDALRDRHLLFLGCGFPDWLARFFIRTVKNEPFVFQRKRLQYVADEVAKERSLLLFLKSYETRVYIKESAADFVAKLHDKWAALPASADPPPITSRPMPDDAVFLSHAAEDVESVRRVRDALAQENLPVWLVERPTPEGFEWERLIKPYVKKCSFFLPCISRNTEAALGGRFEVEWRLALARRLPPAYPVPFIRPIVLDDTRKDDSTAPPELREREWFPAPDGRLPSDFVTRIRNGIRALREQRAR